MLGFHSTRCGVDMVGVTKVQCPYCDFEDTRVIDSRLSEGKDAIRRRRECLSCSKRFTTYERREPLRLMVLKKDGTREPEEALYSELQLQVQVAKHAILSIKQQSKVRTRPQDKGTRFAGNSPYGGVSEKFFEKLYRRA